MADPGHHTPFISFRNRSAAMVCDSQNRSVVVSDDRVRARSVMAKWTPTRSIRTCPVQLLHPRYHVRLPPLAQCQFGISGHGIAALL